MRIYVNREAFIYNAERIKRIATKLNVKVAYIEKNFAVGLVDTNNVRTYSNKSGYISYKLNSYVSGSIGGVFNTIYALSLIDSEQYEVYVPLNLLEDREGVSIETAKQIKEYCESIGLTFGGVMLNSGCIGKPVKNYFKLKRVAKKIKRELNCFISLGGSFYLTLKKIPSEVDELRIGETFMIGEVSLAKKIGYNPFTCEVDVLYVNERRKQLIIDCGNTDIADNVRLEKGFTLANINTDYTVVDYEWWDGGKFTFQPDYYTLDKIMNKWKEHLEWN